MVAIVGIANGTVVGAVELLQLSSSLTAYIYIYQLRLLRSRILFSVCFYAVLQSSDTYTQCKHNYRIYNGIQECR